MLERARERLRVVRGSGSGTFDGGCTICDLPRRFGELCGRERTIVHEIIYAENGIKRGDVDEHVETIQRLLSTGLESAGDSNTDNFIIGKHTTDGWSHLHVIHGCSTYQQKRSCRCYQLRRVLGQLPQCKNKKQYGGIGDEETWRKLFFYLLKPGRQVYKVALSDKSWERVRDCESADLRDSGRCEAEIHTKHNCSIRVCDALSCSAAEKDVSRLKRKITDRPEVQRQNRSNRGRTDTELGEEIQKLITKWVPLSIQNFINNPKFVTKFPELKFDEKRAEKLIKPAFRYVRNEQNKMKGAELLEMLWQRPWVFFQDGHAEYYDPEFSYQVLIRLLYEQFHCDEEVERFLNNVIDVVDKNIPKKNSIALISPPSSGKTFIANSLAAALINVGFINTSSKQSPNRFAFQDAHNTRIAIWNEAMFCSDEQVQKAKEVLEGCPTSIEKKFCANTIMERTPIIITSNGIPWRAFLNEKKAFEDRCFVYSNWQPQPWLKKLRLKINPLAWYFVFCHDQKMHWDTFPTKEELIEHQNEHIFANYLRSHYPHKL